MTYYAGKLAVQIGADTNEGERKIRGFVEKQAGVLEKGFGGMAAAVGLGITAAVVRRAGEAVVGVSKLAEANRAVESSFEGLATQAGASSEQMLDALDTAAAGTISDYDLMLSANKAMQLGVADSAQEMADLMEMARTRGQSMGLTAQQAFGDIVTGLGRGSALILDNLGIVVDLESAYSSYATQLGKTAESLTEAEKKQALINETMRQSATAGIEPLASNFERMDAAMANLKVSMGDLFGPAVTAAVNAVTQVVDKIDETAESFANPVSLPLETQMEDAVGAVSRLREEWAALQATMSEQELDDAYYLSDLMLYDPIAFGNLGRAADETILKLAELEQAEARLVNVQSNLEAAQWSAGENVRLQNEAAAADAVAVSYEFARLEWDKTVAAWERGGDQFEATYGRIEQMVQDMAMDLLPDMGPQVFGMEDAWAEQFKTQFDNLIGYSDNERLAIIAQNMRQVAGATREAGDAAADAGPSVSSLQAQLDRMAMAGAQELFEAIGPGAWDAFGQMEAAAQAAYDTWIQKTGNAEIAQYMAANAVSDLSMRLAAINGARLDEVGVSAGIAATALATAARQAEWLNNALNQGVSSLQGMYMGALDVYSRDEAMAREEATTQGLEMYLSMLSERGASERELAYAEREYTNWVQEGITTERTAQAEQRQMTTAVSGTGKAAQKATSGLRELEGMLGQVTGLFDPSEVTQEDMDKSAAGMYKEKPDEYLRRLRDEMKNGKDWEGVDVETAAEAIGWTPEAARANAEMFLNEFTAAWANSSLFADPANIDKFLNVEAVQAQLEQQLKGAEGEKNLKALFGIGDEADVTAIAALGLQVQDGLSGWLAENGLTDAGAAMAAELGKGVTTASDVLGSGITDGFGTFIGSADGQSALHALGVRSARAYAKGIADGLPGELPGQLPNDSTGGATGGTSGGAAAQGELPTTRPRSGGVQAEGVSLGHGQANVNFYDTIVQAPIDIAMLANAVAKRLKQRRA